MHSCYVFNREEVLLKRFDVLSSVNNVPEPGHQFFLSTHFPIELPIERCIFVQMKTLFYLNYFLFIDVVYST